MQPESSAYLWDARDAARRVTEFLGGMDEFGYRADPLRRSAVERQLEIVGEASTIYVAWTRRLLTGCRT